MIGPNWIVSIVLLGTVSVGALSPAQGQDVDLEDPMIVYRLNDADFSIRSSYSEGPDQRTQSSSSMSLVIDMTGFHGYPQTVAFVVLDVSGFDSNDGVVPLGPYATATPEEKRDMPLAMRQDNVLGLVWFEEPWPGLEERDFTFELPINGSVFGKLRVLDYTTYDVGHELADATRLLGDEKLPESTRRAVASRLSHAQGKRYQYLTDKGGWSVPEDVPAFLPDAPKDQ